MPYDHLPMIGPLRPALEAPVGGDGLGEVGAHRRDVRRADPRRRRAGREHEWAPTFSPSRVSLSSTPEVAKLGAKFSALMAADRVTPAEARTPDDVPPGEARVVREGSARRASTATTTASCTASPLRCTHLGCLLRFNGAERSWDCPCHGSRFDVDGECPRGPGRPPARAPRSVTCGPWRCPTRTGPRDHAAARRDDRRELSSAPSPLPATATRSSSATRTSG